jgi:hypothetical protein
MFIPKIFPKLLLGYFQGICDPLCSENVPVETFLGRWQIPRRCTWLVLPWPGPFVLFCIASSNSLVSHGTSQAKACAMLVSALSKPHIQSDSLLQPLLCHLLSATG